MSADVWIETDCCGECGRADRSDVEVNITYNLSGMLREAGFTGWRDFIGMEAREAGRHLIEVLDGMAKDPERFRAMNPPNGWGDYDQCLQGRLRAFAEQCLDASDNSRIGGWL